MSLTIDALRVAAPSSSAVRRAKMTGGKGAKGGNLESLGNTGPAAAGAKRRKPAQTHESAFSSPYSGAQVFSGAARDWRIACGNCGNPQAAKRVALAEIAEIAKAAVSLHAPLAVRKNSRSPQSAPAQYPPALARCSSRVVPARSGCCRPCLKPGPTAPSRAFVPAVGLRWISNGRTTSWSTPPCTRWLAVLAGFAMARSRMT